MSFIIVDKIKQKKKRLMSSLTIYIREKNGKGDKLEISDDLTMIGLYEKVCQLLGCEKRSIKLFYRARMLPISQKVVKSSLENQSIIHIRRAEESCKSACRTIKVYINWQSQQYDYKINNFSTVGHLKKFMEKDVKAWGRKIVLSYEGRQLKDEEVLSEAGVEDGSLLSLCLIMEEVQYRDLMKPKIAKSITFNEIHRQVDAEEIVQRLKEANQRKVPLLPHPEPQQPKQQGGLQLITINSLWNGKTIIETESVCDSEEDEDNPDLWTECYFSVINKHQTREYCWTCLEGHNLDNILKKLTNLENCEQKNIKWVSRREIRDFYKGTILDAAREKEKQILGPYIFQTV